MTVQEVEPAKTLFPRHGPALGRTDFVKELRPHDDDDGSAPICDGIAEKRAQVSFWIEEAVTDQPHDQ